MNKNVLYVVVAVIIFVGVGALLYSRSNNKTASEQQQADTAKTTEQSTNEEQTPMTSNDSCVRTFKNADLAAAKVNATDKFVTLTVAGFGDIKIEVNRTAAPKSSENFLKLAAAGFYDCISFHRVAKGFVIQGGDPDGNGSGGPGYTIPAEIGLKHTKGSVAMARLGDQVNPKRDSSGSQFYISLQELPMLDGQYSVFGNVVAGMDVVEKIGQVAITAGPFGGNDGAPVEPVMITKAVISAQ